MNDDECLSVGHFKIKDWLMNFKIKRDQYYHFFSEIYVFVFVSYIFSLKIFKGSSLLSIYYLQNYNFSLECGVLLCKRSWDEMGRGEDKLLT